MIPDAHFPIEESAPATNVITIRGAVETDVSAIVALVNHHAHRGKLLPRTAKSVADSVNDWLVAATEDELLGCVSLLQYTSGLVEVRSLAVKEDAQGLGIGTQLMRRLLHEARRRQIPTLFALTRVVGFFQRFGFAVTDKAFFPEKVWHDCQQCPLRDNCDETAVVLNVAEIELTDYA